MIRRHKNSVLNKICKFRN